MCARALAADCRAALRGQSDPGIVRIRAGPDVRGGGRQVHAASQNLQGQEQVSVLPSRAERWRIAVSPAAAGAALPSSLPRFSS